MKAITLTQPWATLVAIGAKRIETRSWKTNYRGALAIHAAKGLGGLGMEPSGFGKEFDFGLVCKSRYFSECLLNAGYLMLSDLPRGQIVAICYLASVRPTRLADNCGWEWDGPDGTHYSFPLTDMERAFGDYSPHRYAWLLHDIRRLPEPIPARGSLGLWDFDKEL